jgi:hypothetical protein
MYFFTFWQDGRQLGSLSPQLRSFAGLVTLVIQHLVVPVVI